MSDNHLVRPVRPDRGTGVEALMIQTVAAPARTAAPRTARTGLRYVVGKSPSVAAPPWSGVDSPPDGSAPVRSHLGRGTAATRSVGSDDVGMWSWMRGRRRWVLADLFPDPRTLIGSRLLLGLAVGGAT